MVYIVSMETENKDLLLTNLPRDEDEAVLIKVCSFLQMDMPKLTEKDFTNRLKELCAIKIFNSIGIRNFYNRNNRFFNFTSTILIQAISDKLNLNLNIAPASIRFVRYNGINFVNRVVQLLEEEELTEAVIDTFNLADDNHKIVEQIDF